MNVRMNLKIIIGVARAIMLGYAMAVSAVITYFLADLLVRPHEPIALAIENATVHPGESLFYESTFRRNKICKTDVQRFLFEADDFDLVIYRDQLIGNISEGARREIRVKTKMPMPALPAGDYVLRVVVISTCTLVVDIAIYNDVPFTIESQ